MSITSQSPVTTALRGTPQQETANQPLRQKLTELVHISLAGPGSWKNNPETGQPELSFMTGGLAALLKPEVLDSAAHDQKVTWLCSPASPEDFIHPDFIYSEGPGDGAQVRLLRPQDMLLASNEIGHFKEVLRGEAYGEFCKNALWMTLHGHSHTVSPEHLAKSFESYKAVNEAFARKLVGLVEKGEVDPSATIVVHDFQLAMVPKYLKEMMPELKVTGYWHVPMPTRDNLFQSLSGRSDVGLPDEIAGELFNAIANTPEVRWGTHSQQWLENFESCLDYAGLARDGHPTLYINPGFLDPQRLKTQAFGTIDQAQFLDGLKTLGKEITSANEPQAHDDFAFWQQQILTGDVDNYELESFVRHHNPDGWTELQRMRGLVTHDVKDALLSRLPIDTYDANGHIIKRTFTNEELELTGPQDRGQIMTFVGRADPKNGPEAFLRAAIAIQQDPAITLKPSYLMVCARNGVGVGPYERTWTNLTGQLPDHFDDYGIDPNTVGLIEQLRELGGNIVHADGRFLDSTEVNIEPFAIALSSHDLADIGVFPSERGGRDLVILEAMCLRDKSSRPLLVIAGKGAAASDTLRGAIVVDGIGPAPQMTDPAKQPSSDRAHVALTTKTLAAAYKKALTMSDSERQARFADGLEAVAKELTHTWTSTMTAVAQHRFTPQKATHCAQNVGPALFASI